MGEGGAAGRVPSGRLGSGEVVILSPSALLRAGSAKERSPNGASPPRYARGDTGEWHFWVDEQPRPGYANMAIDLTLLDRAERQGESWLRLYQWQPHCLSFGRHEPASRRYDVERIRTLGLDAVRRPTGGRAVWHSRELTYAVAAPIQRLGSLQAAYLEIHAMLRGALGRLGVEASLAPRVSALALDAGACFSQPAGGEVMVAGRKVIGSAQLRRGIALLQHGSVLLQDDQRVVREVTRGAKGEPAGSSSLQSLLGRPVSSLEAAVAVGSAAADRWSGAWEQVSHPDHVVQAASRYFPRFLSPAWTWVR
jgi:lipoate-protein ligase A